ncbi:MAG TPA: LLM class flavin-dependent oxidoreductase, partial [Pirellulales bacterium]|nr:LLM class flavin-dependent oxidoreductase [Pirellulales bacterium]
MTDAPSRTDNSCQGAYGQAPATVHHRHPPSTPMTNDKGPIINYGMFIMPFHDPAKPLAQGYDEDLELIVRAEDLGFS